MSVFIKMRRVVLWQEIAFRVTLLTNVRPELVLRRETGAVEPVIGPERHPEEVSLGLHVGWLLHAAMTWNLTIRRREI